VRTSKAKYIEYRDLTGMNELYDLEADPYEERNLLGGRGPAPALLEPMQQELKRLVRR
jgi:hypothetical protein